MTKQPRGGTELMAERINSLPPDLLSKFQIIHSRVRELDPNKKKILVCHDLAMDPEVQHLKNGGWQKYDKLVFVSHWQKQQYQDFLGVPPSASVVLENAIEPIEHIVEKPEDTINMIYFSTPHRGLNILAGVFPELANEFPELRLNVFSSFDLYGWEQRDEPYKPIFEMLEAHPQANYSKSVSNGRIRDELKKNHILAYPSIWQETSCLVLIESMSARLRCVHSSLAALPETSRGLTDMYDYTENLDDHAERFYQKMREVILDIKDSGSYTTGQVTKMVIDRHFGWRFRKEQWIKLLEGLDN